MFVISSQMLEWNMLRWVLMGWPGPYSHSRLRAETETSLCSLDREKTKTWALKVCRRTSGKYELAFIFSKNTWTEAPGCEDDCHLSMCSETLATVAGHTRATTGRLSLQLTSCLFVFSLKCFSFFFFFEGVERNIKMVQTAPENNVPQ